MKKRLTFLCATILISSLFTLISCGKTDVDRAPPKIHRGVIDLKDWDFHKDGFVNLSGQWEFYWKKQMDPMRDFDTDPASGFGLIKVPGIWNGYEEDGEKISGKGFATYHLKILLSHQEERLALKLLDMATAFHLYINGKLLASSGTPGKNAGTTVPRFYPVVAEFDSDSSQIDIVIHVSNFHHWQGGMWEPLLLGTAYDLKTVREKRLVFNFFLFGSILIMGLYHFGLFWFRRNDYSPLYFGIFCLLIATRILTTGERYILHIFPDIDYEIMNKLIYLSFYICVPVFSMFVKSLFPREVFGKIIDTIKVTGLCFSIFVLFLPARIYTYTMPVFQFFTLLILVYGTWTLLLATMRKRNGALVFLIGFLILFITAINDILYTRQIINTGHFSQIGFFIFIFSQALLISQRFSMAFSTVERQSHELLSANVAYKKEINYRKQAEKALKESESKYRALFYDSMDAMNLTQNGKIMDVNQAWLKMHGFESKSEVTGTDVIKYIHPDDRKVLTERRKTWSPNIDRAYQLRDIRKDGSILYVEVYSSSISFDNRFLILCSVRDITEKKRSMAEKEQLEARLQQSEKMEAVGTLAGGIAHDFNNILAAIIGYTELALVDVKKESRLEKNLREVYTAGIRAKDLVKQILTFARRSEGEQKPIRVDLIAKEALKLLRSSIPTSIQIKQNIVSDSSILGDPTQVHQIFMNLCANAFHAMEKNGGILEVRLKDVELDGISIIENKELKPGDYLKISVSDTGTGIAPDILKLIFEPYFTTKATGEGTGMGLATVHGIVKSYSGKITVESKLGKGTVFRVYLPITQKKTESKEYKKEDLPTGTERILLVDDELPIVDMGSQMLERLGYTVTTSTSSVEAGKLFSSKPDSFDLVITDMTMPNLTGDRLAAELIKIRPDIPIILCTGYSKRISNKLAAEIGIRAFVMKPLVMHNLANTIREVLDQ